MKAVARMCAGASLLAISVAGCTNTTSTGVSALVPPSAVTSDTSRKGAAAKTAKLADAPEVVIEKKPDEKAKKPPVATAFAPAAEKRPKVEVAAQAEKTAPKAKPTGLFAAFLKSNSTAQAQAARNRREAEQRLAKLKKRRADRLRKASAKRVSRSSSTSALPGVRTERVFGIEAGAIPRSKKRASKRPKVVLASVAAAARGSGRTLARQHKGVSVNCLKPSLVKRIRMAERHFGRRAVVTSGYRSPRHNRRVRGARRSMHMSCAAADVQISGISKWQLAKYFRSQAGRGGVGTYCHTRSVHVDVGAKRDWNWRCRRKKRRRS